MKPTTNRRGPYVGRRTVLLSLAGIVVGAAELQMSVPDSLPGAAGDAATADGTLGALSLPQLARVEPRAPVSVTTTIPRWARRWKAPVYDLGDFIDRMPHTHFPKRSIMLTMDDGPQPYWTPRFLRLFEKHDVQATFHLIGAQVPSQRKLVRAMASQGHVLANHSWTHDEGLPYRSRKQIRQEIERTNDAIEKAAKVRPRIYRAPGGAWGHRIFEELAHQQMLPLGWDIDPRDWALPGTSSIAYALRQAGPGNILLAHDGGGDRAQTYAALSQVIPALKARGLHFVTLPVPQV